MMFGEQDFNSSISSLLLMFNKINYVSTSWLYHVSSENNYPPDIL